MHAAEHQVAVVQAVVQVAVGFLRCGVHIERCKADDKRDFRTREEQLLPVSMCGKGEALVDSREPKVYGTVAHRQASAQVGKGLIGSA